ncbi:TerB N-terminal domain-containing protein [Aminivibrio sp.]|uniref:tellurite resistance TerB family protein n=1 Tax=Aminivibrio sp. TaxID=1872489 RepID=UPI001A453681|nr:TerB N-terminal domain-containing protein [Aminivibrio sp.]MBL3540707.1 TerB N-terminal domain-containing protein [Aminivibrio sp.]
MELFLAALTVTILYRTARAFLRLVSGRKDRESPGKLLKDSETGRPGAAEPARWFGSTEMPAVNGYSVPGGLVYVGEKLLDYSGFNDPCLLNPSLRAAPGLSPSAPLPEQKLHYGKMTPEQRGAYLSWLAGGRNDPDAAVPYVFLFFYGLERRLMVDGQRGGVSPEERSDMVLEVLRLLQIYGGHRTFRGHARNLLAMEWVLWGNPDDRPGYIDFSDRYCAEPFTAVLARYAALDRPIPADAALQWLILHPEQGLKTSARRCPDLFRELFFLRYREKYGEGIIIHPNRTPLTLTYRAATPSLGDWLKIRIPGLPNPFVLTAPVKRLAAIAARCAGELDGYSRFLARGGSPESPEAAALLPAELLTGRGGGEQLRERLARLCPENPSLTDMGKILAVLGQRPPLKMDRERAAEIADALAAFDFGMAPDPGIHGFVPLPHGPVALFSPRIVPSAREKFAALTALIRLGSLVAQVSGEATEGKRRVVENLVSSDETLSQEEKRSLSALSLWAFAVPQGAAYIRGVLKHLPEETNRSLGRILGAIAAADGRVDPSEVRAIGKLYGYLGLNCDQAARDIHAAVSGSFVPSAGTNAKGFSLDMDLIRLRQEEAREVNGVLREIVASPEEALPAQKPPEADDPLAGLDGSHRELLSALLKRETWRRQEYESLCASLSLHPDGALEILNEWAFPAAGAPLAEDGDPLYIDLSLAQEVLSHGQQEDENSIP